MLSVKPPVKITVSWCSCLLRAGVCCVSAVTCILYMSDALLVSLLPTSTAHTPTGRPALLQNLTENLRL